MSRFYKIEINKQEAKARLANKESVFARCAGCDVDYPIDGFEGEYARTQDKKNGQLFRPVGFFREELM